MGWITTERDARVTKHQAMPVRDCPVIKGEIADPDGREMFKNGRPFVWPELHGIICMNCNITTGSYSNSFLDSQLVSPVVCVFIIEPEGPPFELFKWRWYTTKRHMHMCARCYREFFGTE